MCWTACKTLHPDRAISSDDACTAFEPCLEPQGWPYAERSISQLVILCQMHCFWHTFREDCSISVQTLERASGPIDKGLAKTLCICTGLPPA